MSEHYPCPIDASDVAAGRSLVELTPQIVDFIGTKIKDARWAAWLAKRSLRHWNGFTKILLIDVSEWPSTLYAGRKLVLHVWNAADQAINIENIHNHRWTFESVLLAGRLRWEHYITIDTASEHSSRYVCYRYTSPSKNGGGRYTLQRIGYTNLQENFRAEVEAGSIARLHPEQLHRVVQTSTKDAAITLCLQHLPCRTHSDVFLGDADDI